VAQHDYNVANQSGSSFRADLNGALSAIVSQNSGSSTPTTTFAYQMWADTTAGVMKMRDGANAAWITLYELDGTFVTTDIKLGLGTAAAPSLTFTGDLNTGIYSPGADQVSIATNGTQRATVDASGRLLVGTGTARSPLTHSPSLQVEGIGFAASTASVFGNSNDTSGSYVFIGKSRGTAVGSNTVVQSGDEIGGLDFIATDGTQALRAARITALVDGTPGTNDMPGRLVFSTTADGASSTTERMRIDNQGITSIYSLGDPVLAARSSRVAAAVDTVYAGYHSATSTTTGTLSFRVYTNGNVQNTNNSYGAISDLKLKENIVDANSQWNDLKALQVRNYNLKEGQTHTQIGLVAQEAELVSPGLVYESPDRDNEGNDLGTVTKSVNYSVLYMKAVKALQEAMERIETLEAKVAALEAK